MSDDAPNRAWAIEEAARAALLAIEQGKSFDHLDNVIAPALRRALRDPRIANTELRRLHADAEESEALRERLSPCAGLRHDDCADAGCVGDEGVGMTTITINRTTVEQALEAMRCAVPTGKITLYEWDKAMSALRAALAQQAEPVASGCRVMVCGVDCHPGDQHCNGYCTGKADDPPAATTEQASAFAAKQHRERPSCDECGKSKEDGWALYCVGCLENAFRPAKPVEPVASKRDTVCALCAREIALEAEAAPFGCVTVRRLSLSHENHADQYQFYPAGQSPYLDNVDECHTVYIIPPQQAEPVDADAAYQRWLADTHAPALRRMDSQGAFSAGWQAALAQQAEPVEPVAAERERCAEYLMQQAAECRENSPTRVTLESCAAVLRLGLVEWVAQQAEPFTPDAIRTTQTAWKMGYEARKAEEQAEPVAPVAEAATTQQQLADTPPSDYRRSYLDGYFDGFAIGKREGRIEAEDAAKQAEPAQEPWASRELFYKAVDRAVENVRQEMKVKTVTMRLPEYDITMPIIDAYSGHVLVGPVVPAPPQRKPLTDEDIERIFMTYQSPRQAARAVERAHNITDPQIEDRLARHGIPMPEAPTCHDCRGIGYDASGQLCGCQDN